MAAFLINTIKNALKAHVALSARCDITAVAEVMVKHGIDDYFSLEAVLAITPVKLAEHLEHLVPLSFVPVLARQISAQSAPLLLVNTEVEVVEEQATSEGEGSDKASERSGVAALAGEVELPETSAQSTTAANAEAAREGEGSDKASKQSGAALAGEVELPEASAQSTAASAGTTRGGGGGTDGDTAAAAATGGDDGSEELPTPALPEPMRYRDGLE